MPLAFGTDSGVHSHGMNARQLGYRVELGTTPLDAIQSATVVAAQLVGWPGLVGSIEPGEFADPVAVEGDPLLGVGVLTEVEVVMKGGKVVRARDGLLDSHRLHRRR